MEKFELKLKNIANEYNIDLNTIDSKTLARLKEIYAYVHQEQASLDEFLSKSIHSKGFTITDITENLSCTRQTIYNNPILKLFIDSCSEDYLSAFKLYLQKKNEYVAELLQENRNLKNRDVDYLEVLAENKELKDTIKSLRKDLADLRRRFIN